MTALLLVLGVYGFLLLCWVLYISVMNFKTKRDTLHWFVKLNAYLILAIGLVLDLILALVIGPILFFSLPYELTLTSALKRHRAAGGWRGVVAAWICEQVLNPFIVGGHC